MLLLPAVIMEVKFLDVDLDNADGITAAGEVSNSLSLMAQGDGESERDGRTAFVRGVSLNGNLFLSAVDDAASPREGEGVRLILVLDTQANGAFPVATDILSTADINSHFKASSLERFDVLWDERFDLNYSGGPTDYAGVVEQFEFSCACEFPLDFSGTAASIGNVATNNLVLLSISKNALAGMRCTSRLFFVG